MSNDIFFQAYDKLLQRLYKKINVNIVILLSLMSVAEFSVVQTIQQ